MSILFYDVETTGLPDWKKPSNDPCQPHIIQIAAVKTDDEGNVLTSMQMLIRPDGWELPDNIAELTGVTTERLNESGVPIKEAVKAFIGLWRECKISVAHNDSFDRRMLRIELARIYGREPILEEWKAAPSFCTMLASTGILNLPPTEKMVAAGFNKPKAPKLEEAYHHFFGAKPAITHDAMADVESTVKVYFAIKKHNEIKEPETPHD